MQLNSSVMKHTETSRISFDDTALAFAYKSDRELRRARFLFSAMGNRLLLKICLSLTPMAIKMRLPLVRSAIRKTIFRQFIGGEDMKETVTVARNLSAYKTDIILDYGVEGGSGEDNFESASLQFKEVVEFAASVSNIPFISIKITGIARFSLLEKIDSGMRSCDSDTLMKRYLKVTEGLPVNEKEEWKKVVERIRRVCETASVHGIGVLVDAEESWIQEPVDALCLLMMDSFNKGRCVVYNTIQLYRHDRLEFLKKSHEASKERNFMLGSKLVRGAYMEKERARALDYGYASPIHANKASTDRDYEHAVTYCLDHLDSIGLIVATHNENSNLLAVSIMEQKGIEPRHPHVHFSQLYGMSDNITFNLAAHGYNVSKYLPFGPIEDVVPYLMRRAQENSSVAGQTGRELMLINKELKRRRGVGN
jgi:proline dehydrogenase